MTRKTPLYLITLLLSTIFVAGCNDKSADIIETVETYANTSISSFSLQKDDSVLAHLDSVFFSIDLVGARIFNADSLPVGTDISRLLVKLETASASACEFTFRVPDSQRDTTIDIISHPNDSINFSEGPVKLVVTSFDGTAKRTYQVSVNVHKSVPDTLIWSRLSSDGLPSALTSATSQKTVFYKEAVYCFTSDGTSYSLARSNDPFDNTWDKATVTLPAGADINSIQATTEALYLIDADGMVHTSTDGLSWQSTGCKMNYLYGGYGATLLGARRDTDGWKHVTYPATTENAVAAGCPIAGTSGLINYETKWSDTPMAITLGGRKADGSLTGEAWVYDGANWTQLSTTGLKTGAEGVTVFPYSTIRTNKNNWKVNERSALIAFGGLTGAGKATKDAFVSYDFGITWSEADSYLHLPEEMEAFYGAQAVIYDTTLPVSRYTRPVESWECPYIYLFGGYTGNGALINEIYRGVINRFTFKPIY